jgi:TonB family C-terminal domain
MRSFSLTLACLALLPMVVGADARAQTIGGRVIDVPSHRPIALMPVQVLDDSSRVVTSTHTDAIGIFYALLPSGGRYRVRFLVDSVSSVSSDTIRVLDDAFVQREFLVEPPHAFLEFQVEKMTRIRPGANTPRFPIALRGQDIQGEVIVQFVVDSSGQPRMDTFRVVRSTHSAFTDAVRDWLPKARFYPAEIGGRHVAQMVQMPFTFQASHEAGTVPAQPRSLFPPTPPPVIPPLPGCPRC